MDFKNPYLRYTFFFLLGLMAFYIYQRYFHIPGKTVTVNKRSHYDIVTLKLPSSMDTDVFGPEYWKAFHTLAEMIPCSICRKDAVPLLTFTHDIVNKKLGKSTFDQENYDKWTKRVIDLKDKKPTVNAKS